MENLKINSAIVPSPKPSTKARECFASCPIGRGGTGEAGNVLIIDDEPGIRDLLTYELTHAGYSVSRAGDGEEGIRLLQKNTVDVIVTDFKMPKKSGLDVLCAAKKISPAAEVIIMTGFGTIEDAVGCLKMGAYDYVLKPFNLDEILVLVSRAMEKRFLQAQVAELTELDRLHSEFVANMSHELRTPLSAITGYTSLLMENTYGDLNEEQTKALTRIKTNSKDLLFIVNNILDFSKVQVGRMPLSLERFDLVVLVRETLDMLEFLLHEKPDLKFNFSLPEELSVYSDSSKIKQIIVNLVSNAVKFTEQGRVSLSVTGNDGDTVEITVLDTGIGIPRDKMSLIFEPFRQADGSATRAYGGIGLGLAIVKNFAKMLGGGVTVESVPCQGSKFTVTMLRELKPNHQQVAQRGDVYEISNR